MPRFLVLSILPITLLAGTALADPGIRVDYRDEILRVTLDGSYAREYYQALRSDQRVGEYSPLTSQYALCTGDCFLTDLEVAPGRTYFYRFDFLGSGGRVVSFGPYAVTVPDVRLGARVSPNPSRGDVRVELSLPGSPRRDGPLGAEAHVLDLQGRTVRTLHSGVLSRGVTALAWDGAGESGRPLGAGVYFLRLTTPIGSSTSRIVRLR